jgi:putative addiction module CopG family antidote
MNVLLRPEMEEFVARKLQSGQFRDASELVNLALEVLREQEEFTPEHEEYLRGEIKKGIEDLDAGRFAEFDAAKIITEERQRVAVRKGRE